MKDNNLFVINKCTSISIFWWGSSEAEDEKADE